MKDRLIAFIMEEHPHQQAVAYAQSIIELTHNIVPKSPGRSFPRKKGAKATKYLLTKRRCLW